MTLLVKILLGIHMAVSAQLMSEYTQKTGKLSTLEKKIIDLKAQIKAQKKAHRASGNEEAQRTLYTEIISLHVDYKKSVAEYNSIRHDLKYKFPQKNDQTNRRYLPIRPQSVDEIENEKGIDTTLTRMKQKIDKKYAPYIEEPEDPRAFVKKTEKVEKKRIRLER